MKKIFLCLIIISMVAVFSLAGCKGEEIAAEEEVAEEEETSEETTELVYYWNPDHLYNVYEEVINDFASEKGLTINKQVFNWDEFNTKIKADFVAGTVPDLIEVPAPWVAEFGSQGLLEDITTEIDNWSESKDWFDSTWIEVSYDGKKYGLKFHNTCFALFYNKDHFREAGLDPENPPKTLEELQIALEKINEKYGDEVKGFGFDPSGQYSIPMIASAETPSLIKDGKSALDTPAIRETFSVIRDIAKSGFAYIPDPGGEDSRTNARLLFLTGKTSMMISGPWEIGTIKADYPDLDYGVAMVPHISGVDAKTLTAGTALAIPKGAKLSKELVIELMKRLTSVETEVAATLEAGMLMPRKTWASDDRVKDDKGVLLFGPILPNAVPFDIDARILGVPEITWGGAIYTKLYQTILYSDDDVNEALDDYIEEVNQLIAGK